MYVFGLAGFAVCHNCFPHGFGFVECLEIIGKIIVRIFDYAFVQIQDPTRSQNIRKPEKGSGILVCKDFLGTPFLP